MFPYCKLKETEVRSFLNSVTESQVKETLKREKVSFTGLLTLLSPAAGGLIDEMQERSAAVKRMHFGKTIRLYSPLYISSYCINDCAYCGFRTSHHAERRKRLSKEQIIEEAKIIKDYGIDSLVLVSGEDPNAVSVDFFADTVRELKKMFSYISIEVYPMDKASYSKLFEAGVHGLTIYQETYNQELYKKLHRSGPKTDYLNRLQAVVNGGEAGFYNLGIGALLGLYDWRIEAASVAAHGLWLKKRFWKSKIQFSFPRITPTEGGFEVPCPVSEKELEQMMLAFRLFFHEADLYISTRESAEFRKRAVATCASHMSAASQVIPGGYALAKENKELGQFTVNDTSSVESVQADLESLNLEAVFKDWDCCIGS